jgi:hypothetical protein
MSLPRFVCLLFLRPDATPAKRKKLGKAIRKWSLKEEESGIQAFFDPKPVQDLRVGELPQPLALRMTLNAPEPDEESRRLLEDGGGLANLTLEQIQGLRFDAPPPESGPLARAREGLRRLENVRAVLLFAEPGPGGRDRVVDGLRHWLPAELVADIFITGSSWNAKEE